ncbi:hypothetical protein BDW74DRAFT_143966 [Aspergillus multicolor]|uniref:uncharacterized protein n=1 Tax=Aspergillus multicolor TaxID=41759 RepID=UPI003CCD4E22
MTTTSSFPFATMEVPTIDDKMEMASPFHVHGDDFEIDIDVMEDQASNADRDMTTADDYMDNSHGENHGQDVFPDEDMIDDVAEPSMIDPDEYTEANQNIDMHYENGKTDEERKIYEAEMLEDEYDEDIDAPVLDSHDAVPEFPVHTDSEEAPTAEPNDQELPEDADKNNAKSHLEVAKENLDTSQSKVQLSSDQSEVRLDDEEPVEGAVTGQVESRDLGEAVDSTTKAEQAEQAEQTEWQPVHNHHHGNSEDIQNEAKDGGQPTYDDDHKETEVEAQEQLQLSESKDQETEEPHELTDASPLHPVKVYYQDNEISLFPPREGDASETFFLEDEGLAYESFGKLFVACREVLQNHITENELLVIDIEALNFQLTEDSLETHNFTLKQIVDVYLQLCHNDGFEEPEALYLTLSTRLTLAAELSDLLIAASEGKGLSEIQSWEVYPDAEGAADFEETDHELSLKEQQDTPDNQNNDGSSIGLESKLPAIDKDLSNPKQGTSAIQGTDNIENAEDGEVAANASDLEDQEDVLSRAASQNSEEGKSESTGTLEALPVTDLSEERLEPGEVDEHPHDEAEHHSEVYYEGDHHLDDEAHPEEGSLTHITGAIDDLEDPGADVAGYSEEDATDLQDLESYHEQPPLGEDVKTDTPNEGTTALDSQSEERTEPPLDGIPTEKSHPQPVVDDSLDAADDAKSTDSDSNAVGLTGVGEANEPNEIEEAPEKTVSHSSHNDEGADLPFEDEEDYLDLGIADDLDDFDEDQETAPTSLVSGKRFREPDDELGYPESTTPDVKRSRSS